MKRLPEVYVMTGWFIYFIIYGFVFRWIISGGWALSGYFLNSPLMQHVCVLSGIAAHLIASYLLFRLIVRYLVRKSCDGPASTI
jgi:hypothetical protein